MHLQITVLIRQRRRDLADHARQQPTSHHCHQHKESSRSRLLFLGNFPSLLRETLPWCCGEHTSEQVFRNSGYQDPDPERWRWERRQRQGFRGRLIPPFLFPSVCSSCLVLYISRLSRTLCLCHLSLGRRFGVLISDWDGGSALGWRED